MLFFELIQVALGNKEKLSHNPTEKEWHELYAMCQKQTVAGVAFFALDKLSRVGQKPPQAILFEWIGLSEQIKQRNVVMNKRCEELQQRLSEEGIRSSVLKGQGIAKYYDKELCCLRQSGDIDVYVDCGREKAIELALKLQGEPVDWDYKHLHLHLWNDVEIEMHYRVEVLLNLVKNARLQKWFQKHQDAIHGSRFTVQNGVIVTPTVEFNVFYILLHIYRHFLYEGVGLRQIIDYYFVLKKFCLSRIREFENGTNHTKYATDAIKEFGMTKFAKGLMWVMQETLGMPKEWMLWEPDEKEGMFILEEMMKGGNFGHYGKSYNQNKGFGYVQSVIKHNVHLFTHYPQDTIWAPVWLVWHKCWKMAQS